MIPVILEAWQTTTAASGAFWVPPDGCRDLIIHTNSSGRRVALIAPLADQAYTVEGVVGERYLGYRFQPGAQFDESRLLRALQLQRDPDTADLNAIIGEEVRLDARIHEALQGLAACPSVAVACRQLGVGERTLQRLLMPTGRHPAYWIALGRARRAARALFSGAPLTALACDVGYADQAHMTRAFQRWFKHTPGQLRSQPTWLGLLSAPAFA